MEEVEQFDDITIEDLAEGASIIALYLRKYTENDPRTP